MLSSQHSHTSSKVTKHDGSTSTFQQLKDGISDTHDRLRHGHDKHRTGYATRFVEANIETPKYELPKQQMSSAAAYQIIHDEMQLNAYVLYSFRVYSIPVHSILMYEC
jgi:glutamate/tyrosine decarboxylase-like PLP-dependent enzyme